MKNKLHYVHTDHLGRPEIVSDSHQNTVWRAENKTFDRKVRVNKIGGLSIGFPGQYWDKDKQSWYNGFRDYDSTIGRYLQSDPIGTNGGINTYSYVLSNPVRLVDVLGLGPKELQPGGGPEDEGNETAPNGCENFNAGLDIINKLGKNLLDGKDINPSSLYASRKKNKDGSYSIKTFKNEDTQFDFEIENDGWRSINGVTTNAGKITIYKSATVAVTRRVRLKNLTMKRLVLTGAQHAAFVTLHEVAHANGIRDTPTSEFEANSFAVEALGL